MKWRWSLLHCIHPSEPVLEYILDNTTTSPLHHDDNLANNTTTISGIAIHQSSRRHQITALHSSTASSKSVLNSKQNYLPRLGRRVCPDPLPRIIPCSTHLRAWIIQRTSLLTNLSYSPAAFCYSVLYSIHCDIVTRPVVHQI